MLQRLLIFCFFCLITKLTEAKTTTAITNNGNWTTAGTWDNGVPAGGDVIIIPLGINVNLSNNVDLRGGGTTTISISGSLTISDFVYLWLDSVSDALNVLSGGSLIPDGLGGRIRFGNGFCCGLPETTVLINALPTPLGSNGTVPGPAVIANGTLPVTLISFNAIVNNNSVQLEWVTASELNNDFFTIERSMDAENFENLIRLKGNGTTEEKHTYEFSDNSPFIGRSYYRLKQTDFDGKVSYSDLVVVDYEGPKFASLSTFPNPSNGMILTLQLKGIKEVMDVPVVIVSMQGQQVYDGVMHVDETGKSTVEIKFNNPLATGIYIVKAGPTVFLTQKVAVIR